MQSAGLYLADDSGYEIAVDQHWRLMAQFARERQKQMVSDSKKLLILAQELDAKVDTPTHAEITSNELKKAEQIESLAKRLRKTLVLQ